MAKLSGPSIHLREWPASGVAAWAGVYPTHISHMVVKGRTDMWHVPFHCTHLVLRGPVRLHLEPGMDTLLNRGDMFAIYPHRPFAYHVAESASGRNIELYAMRLGGLLVGEYMSALGYTPTRQSFHSRQPEAARHIFRELLEIADNPSDDASPRGVALLYQLLNAAQYQAPAVLHTMPLAERGLELMRTELATGCNVEEIARALGVSRTTLFHAFRKHYGRSPIEMLMQLRLDRAKALLRQSALPVREVAANAGYGHISHFTRVFSQTVGCSPSAWRKSSG